MTAQASNTGPLICRLILMPNDPLGQINSNNPHPCLSSLLAQRSAARGEPHARARTGLQVHRERRGPKHPERLRNGGREATTFPPRPRSALPAREYQPRLRTRSPSAQGPHRARELRPPPPLPSHRGTGPRGQGNLGRRDNETRSQHLQVGTSEDWRPARCFGGGEMREVVTPGAVWDARARGRVGLPRRRLEQGYAALLPSMLPPSPSSPFGGRVVCRARQRDHSGGRGAGFLLFTASLSSAPPAPPLARIRDFRFIW